MNNELKQPAFSLEKNMPGVFVLQALMSGVFAGLGLTVTTILLVPVTYEPLFILYTPILLGICVIWCVCLSLPFWLFATVLDLPLPAYLRIILATVVSMIVAVFADYFPFELEDIDRGLWFISFAICTGVTAGTLVGSSVRPWGFLTFGTVRVKQQDRWERLKVRSVLALIATLPLRLLSVTLLGLFLLILANVRQQWDTRPESLLLLVFWIIYFVVAIYVSYRSPRLLFLIPISLVLNAPLTWVAIVSFRAPRTGFFGALPLVIAIYCSVFLFLWATCVVARVLAARKSRRVLRAPSHHHECLGTRFFEWKTNSICYQKR
jgi:hypothetical protein